MGEFAGRVVVVVGGTRGIGRACADSLEGAGATVIAVGRASVDVTDAGSVTDFFKRVGADHGRLDGLVVAAGIMAGAPLGMIQPDRAAELLAVNVGGTVSCLQAGARLMMRKRSGSIVLFGSVVGEHGNAGQTVYAASKAAVSAAGKSAAKELGRYGIRVNTVAPGVIRTDLTADQSPATLERVVRDTALGRLGEPGDVAGAVRFLLSDAASFVTGAVIPVDGGLVQ